MMNTKILFALLFASLFSMSFENKQSEVELKFGTYGYCKNCSQSNSKIELKINKDSTFTYFDNTNTKKVIDVKGFWTRTKNTLLLKGYSSTFKIHNKWKIVAKGFCLKSRKDLMFEQLCLQ